MYGIYFDFGSDRIRPESESVLKEIADAMTVNPPWKLSVKGHTDDIGGDTYNHAIRTTRGCRKAGAGGAVPRFCRSADYGRLRLDAAEGIERHPRGPGSKPQGGGKAIENFLAGMRRDVWPEPAAGPSFSLCSDLSARRHMPRRNAKCRHPFADRGQFCSEYVSQMRTAGEH